MQGKYRISGRRDPNQNYPTTCVVTRRPMCSDADPGAPDFSSAAHNKSIPERTSDDIRKFKSLAANTRASRPEGVRLRRAPSKFTDDEVSANHLAEVTYSVINSDLAEVRVSHLA